MFVTPQTIDSPPSFGPFLLGPKMQIEAGKKMRTLDHLGFRPINAAEFVERGRNEVLLGK